MCECFACISLGLINTILSVLIVGLNGIFAIWGFFIPGSVPSSLETYVKRLETYVSIVAYSDAALVPLKIIAVMLIRWLCCGCDCCDNCLTGGHSSPYDDSDDEQYMKGRVKTQYGTTVSCKSCGKAGGNRIMSYSPQKV